MAIPDCSENHLLKLLWSQALLADFNFNLKRPFQVGFTGEPSRNYLLRSLHLHSHGLLHLLLSN